MNAGWMALPTCSERQADETIPEYQARLLRFLLATSCTATLTDDQLAQAEVAGCRCCAQTEDLTVVAIVSAARHTIAAILKWRGEQPITLAAVPVQAGGIRPAGGQPAPLVPPPIVRPPAPSYAERDVVEINF